MSALRRCRAVVWEEVRISGYAWLNMPQSGRKSVAELVRRSAPFLRGVHVTLSEDDRNEQTVSRSCFNYPIEIRLLCACDL